MYKFDERREKFDQEIDEMKRQDKKWAVYEIIRRIAFDAVAIIAALALIAALIYKVFLPGGCW